VEPFKERAADADFGGPFPDADFKVSGHSHREIRQEMFGSEAIQFIAEFSQSGEGSPGIVEGVGIWGHRHQAVDLSANRLVETSPKFADLRGRKALFGFFAGDVYFEEEIGNRVEIPVIVFGADALNGSEEFFAVDGMDATDEGEDFADLVVLQVTDQMPADVRRKQGDAFFELLGTAFREVDDTEFDQCADPFQAGVFDDGDQAYGLRASADALAGVLDALAKIQEVSLDLFANEIPHHSSFGKAIR